MDHDRVQADVLEQHDVAGEVLAQLRSVIAAPPYLMTTVWPWNSRMYGERLQQGRDVAGGRHVVYSALIVTYSCERSEKNTSASVPSPGRPTVYWTSLPATAAASARSS